MIEVPVRNYVELLPILRSFYYLKPFYKTISKIGTSRYFENWVKPIVEHGHSSSTLHRRVELGWTNLPLAFYGPALRQSLDHHLATFIHFFPFEVCVRTNHSFVRRMRSPPQQREVKIEKIQGKLLTALTPCQFVRGGKLTPVVRDMATMIWGIQDKDEA